LKYFIWTTTGTKHVDYSPSEAFKGDAATVGRAGHLGSGGFGSVDAVICNGQILTRKRMYFARLDEDCREEAEILEGIIHPHIVQLVGSYTSQSRFYRHLHPVAECNLKEYIQTPEEQRTPLWEQQLKSSFGCLTAAVASLHSKKIAVKHKDIKPTNVLMFSDTPMLTDFGLSTSFKNRDNSVSVGFTGKTTFYAAPEVIAALPRGTSQDVFSLGLVFQDMYWALHGNSSGRAMNPEGNHREGPWAGHKTSDEERAFAKNLPLLAFQCDAPELREEGLLVCLMRLMTAQAPVDRPTATTV
jgi:serine/threonine protein kinase